MTTYSCKYLHCSSHSPLIEEVDISCSFLHLQLKDAPVLGGLTDLLDYPVSSLWSQVAATRNWHCRRFETNNGTHASHSLIVFFFFFDTIDVFRFFSFGYPLLSRFTAPLLTSRYNITILLHGTIAAGLPFPFTGLQVPSYVQGSRWACIIHYDGQSYHLRGAHRHLSNGSSRVDVNITRHCFLLVLL